MLRRHLFFVPALFARPAQKDAKPREWVTATASRDTAPRVGLIPSHFKGGVELDDRKIRPLLKPAALDAPLSAAQLDDMLRLAVELGGGRRGGLATAIDRDDWVVLKVSLLPGAPTDPRLVESTLRVLAERGLGRRISIVEALPDPAAWDAAYKPLVQTLAKQFPKIKYELVDAATAPALEMPVEGHVFNRHNPQGFYRIPRVLRECDKVISIASLAAHPVASIAMSMVNYLGFSPSSRTGLPGEIAVDLFSFHPADYAILGPAASPRRHNVVVAGTNATAVDSVGAAVLGLDSEKVLHLEHAVHRGYGSNEAFGIWTRGSEIDDVRLPATK